MGEVRYSCGGPPGFVPSLLDVPGAAEREAHPSAEALRAAIADIGPDIDFLPAAGWWLVSRDASSAQYLAPRPVVGDDPPFAHASVEVMDGAWRIAGWGDCRPEVLLEGRNVATWVLDDTLPPPGPATTEVTAFVTERTCTGGQPMGARLQPPRITRTDDSVLVVFAAVPLEGDAFDCQGNPSTKVTFDLGEPLGDRQLLDGAFFPAVEPVAPA